MESPNSHLSILNSTVTNIKEYDKNTSIFQQRLWSACRQNWAHTKNIISKFINIIVIIIILKKVPTISLILDHVVKGSLLSLYVYNIHLWWLKTIHLRSFFFSFIIQIIWYSPIHDSTNNANIYNILMQFTTEWQKLMWKIHLRFLEMGIFVTP